MRISMVGAGYVGLVSSACFADFGWTVTCIDSDAVKVRGLQDGIIPIYEPGLDQLVARNQTAGRLQFTTDLRPAVTQSDVVFLAASTPMRRGDGHADLSDVFETVEQLAPHLTSGAVITTKLTVPVGTGRFIDEMISNVRPGADVSVCSNPEFLREGSAIEDFMRPDRILLGCADDRSEQVMRKLYKPLSLREAPIVVTSRETAELAKYAANAFLATKLSFINEVASLCEKVGADVQDLARVIGKDRRIGEKFLHPGPGYGGSGFPKDVAALIRTGREHRAPLTLIETVQHINEERKIEMAHRVQAALDNDVRGKTVGILGVTFKPNTDDMHEAPSLTILPVLAGDGAKLRLYDPSLQSDREYPFPDAQWCDDATQVADGAHAIVLLTEWNEFRALDLSALRQRMAGDVLLDFRNVFSPQHAKSAGFDYHGIGRTVLTGADALTTHLASLDILITLVDHFVTAEGNYFACCDRDGEETTASRRLLARCGDLRSQIVDQIKALQQTTRDPTLLIILNTCLTDLSDDGAIDDQNVGELKRFASRAS